MPTVFSNPVGDVSCHDSHHAFWGKHRRNDDGSRQMTAKSNRKTRTTQGDWGSAVTQPLPGNAELLSIYFWHGANVYTFSYDKGGVRRHTMIDAGDNQHRQQLLAVMADHDVNPDNIERIVITHRHPDHIGLTHLLANRSGAQILVHSGFRSFVEGPHSEFEKMFLSRVDPEQLKECDIRYLDPAPTNGAVTIHGIEFPMLTAPIEIGEGGWLQLIGCPKNPSTHSPDQVIALYSAIDRPHPHEQSLDGFRPSDDIIFAGDLWLMRGPLFGTSTGDKDVHWQLKQGLEQFQRMMSTGGGIRHDPRLQDTDAKNALKRGFCLIQVKPGHGNEFLGTRMIPIAILAGRDLLTALGHDMDNDQSLLESPELAPKVAECLERAYHGFISELATWTELGYTPAEISALLTRIYREQRGGGPLADIDRYQRRIRIKEMLDRLQVDGARPESICRIAGVTRSAVEKIP